MSEMVWDALGNDADEDESKTKRNVRKIASCPEEK